MCISTSARKVPIMKVKYKSIVSLAACLLYPACALSDYVFTAPPRENEKRAIEIYKPIADYLTQATGETFIYRYPDSWTEYSRGIQSNEYDLAFDGPHFVSWRIKHMNHDAVAKLPQLHIWRVIVRNDNEDIQSLEDLIGKKVCAPKSPNFGMLTMMSHYTNPAKEPVHIITKGWKDGYTAVVKGKCVATVLPKTNHKKFDPDSTYTRAIHTHLPYPNQAFTAGPNLSPEMKEKVIDSLLSDDGQMALLKLRERFTRGNKLVSVENEEYEGISMVLKRAGNFLSAGK
ncbi:MAG: PhnD/SsuA/transferrin family substrate-binding protein [Gammaproteobacteria bacterium]|nr:PhnD/SsuA/transferrin family substrate-binding protein [Gammaproteobacteria bacterium]